MYLLDRLLAHDAWTTRQLLDNAQALPDEDLDRDFDIGRRTLRATFQHIIRNMEAWSDAMAGRPARPRGESTISALTSRLDRAAADLVHIARGIEERNEWDQRWTDPHESSPVPRTFGGAIAHVITHSMHHRAQILHMLRRLGIHNLPEGDVLSWEQSVRESNDS